MNSVIIHTLRQRSKLNLCGAEGQVQTEGHNFKHRHSDRQVFHNVASCNIWLSNIYNSWQSLNILFELLYRVLPTLLRRASPVGPTWRKDTVYKSSNQLLSLCHVWSKFRTDLRKLFMSKGTVRKDLAASNVKIISSFNSSGND